MTNGLYCTHIRGLIDDDSVLEDYGPWESEVKGSRGVLPGEYPPFAYEEEGMKLSTTHVNVMAGDGSAVGVTATVGAQYVRYDVINPIRTCRSSVRELSAMT